MIFRLYISITDLHKKRLLMRGQPSIETETASRLLAVSSDSFGVYVFRTTRMSVRSLQVPNQFLST
jgi:hypothetical protein